jgi:PAS domain S-box-containing protein
MKVKEKTREQLMDELEGLRRRIAELEAKELKNLNENLEKHTAERKTMENVLRDSEERFRSTFEQAAVGMAHVALNGQFLRINKRFCEITGHSEQEILKRTFRDITCPDDLNTQDIIRGELLDGKTSSYTMEKRYFKKDGSIIWAHLTVSLVRNSSGEPKYFVSVIEDITERKKAEEQVRKLSHAIEQSSCTVVITDTKGKIEYVNPKFTQLTGYTLEESIGENPSFLKSGRTSSEVYKELWGNITSGKEWRGEFCNKKKNGELYWELAYISPVKNDEGIITNFIAIKDDITERKKMDEMILQTEKLRAMGMITSGVAHDFNNILGVISGNAQLLQGDYGDHKGMVDGLRIIRKAVNDGAEIVSRMKKFTKVERDTSEFMSVSIKEILEQAIEFSRPRWMNIARAGEITYNIDKTGIKKIPDVLGNPSELREVFINIINNALDAMTGGGCMSFCTWNKDDTAIVSISDTGEGMTEEVKKRIFDPFFTTKRGEGSGLGMSVAYGVITGHGGKIEVESEVGKGTTFTMSIPITRETSQQTVSPEPPRKIKAHKLRILVVDDEARICSVLNEFLSKDGNDVKSVNNGTEAIKLLKNEEFGLILCDLVLPDMSGHDIVKVIDELDKKPRVGLITGWDEKIETKSREELKVDFIIRKPFDFSKLTSHINEALNTG